MDEGGDDGEFGAWPECSACGFAGPFGDVQFGWFAARPSATEHHRIRGRSRDHIGVLTKGATMAAEDHEIVSIYGMSDAQIDHLMSDVRECVLNWDTRDHWPVGVMHAFVWAGGKVWITFAAHRHRAEAIRRNPRVSVVVSGVSAHSPDCPKGTATMKGIATFHEDRETKEWFYRALSKKGNPDDKAAEDSFYALLDSPLRTLISIEPKKLITFDSDKYARDRQGLLTAVEKTPRATSDAVRMNACVDLGSIRCSAPHCTYQVGPL